MDNKDYTLSKPHGIRFRNYQLRKIKEMNLDVGEWVRETFDKTFLGIDALEKRKKQKEEELAEIDAQIKKIKSGEIEVKNIKHKKEYISKKAEKEQILRIINNINDFFPEISKDFSSDKVLSLAKEFSEKFKTEDISLANFLKSKGYKFEQEIKQ